MSKVLALPFAALEILAFHQFANFLDFFAMNGAFTMHHLESVVIGRIMAAGDHHAAARLQMENRVIEEGGRDNPQIGHVAAGCQQTREKSVVQPIRTQAAVSRQIQFPRFSAN